MKNDELRAKVRAAVRLELARPGGVAAFRPGSVVAQFSAAPVGKSTLYRWISNFMATGPVPQETDEQEMARLFANVLVRFYKLAADLAEAEVAPDDEAALTATRASVESCITKIIRTFVQPALAPAAAP